MTDDLNMDMIASLAPGESCVWLAMKQPLFEMMDLRAADDLAYFDSDSHKCLLRGMPLMLYKPKKFTYAGTIAVSGMFHDIAAVLVNRTDNNSYLLTDWWCKPHDNTAHNMMRIVDKNHIAHLSQASLTEEGCCEICRSYNTSRMKFDAFNISKHGSDLKDLLREMIAQVEDAERAEYIIDPVKLVEKDLEIES